MTDNNKAIAEILAAAVKAQHEAARAALKAASQLRHDLRYINSMVQMCLEKGDTAEAMRLTRQLDVKLRKADEDDIASMGCDNALPDAVIMRHVRECREDGIATSVQMSPLPPNEEGMPQFALALDTALAFVIGECKKIPVPTHSDEPTRVVRLLGRTQGSQYFLEVAATAQIHGRVLGPAALRQFAAANDAVVECEYDGEMIKLRLLI
jgi:hypothetical protein